MIRRKRRGRRRRGGRRRRRRRKRCSNLATIAAFARGDLEPLRNTIGGVRSVYKSLPTSKKTWRRAVGH